MVGNAEILITAISLVASLLTIVQFFIGKDRAQRISELEERNRQLTSELLKQPNSSSEKSPLDLTKEASYAKLRHQFLLYDRLFRDCAIGSVLFFSLSFGLLGYLITEEDKEPMFGMAALGVPVGFLFAAILHLALRQRLFSKARALVRSMDLTQTELFSLLTWVASHPWKKETAKDTLTSKLNQWA